MLKKPVPSPSSKISTGVSVSASAGFQVQASLDLGSKMLNPFSVADDMISQNIIGIHDSQAVRHDVNSLYNVVTNIVQSSTHIGDSLDLKEWEYQGKPIVVVANTRGEVINKNAMHMIFVWGIKAFPFRHGDDENLSLHWNWFWTEAIKINPDIQPWVTREDKYVFFYGGTDIAWTQRFGTLLENIKRDPVLKQTDTFIEQFNLTKVDPTAESKFWVNITNSFLSKIQKNNFELDSVLKDLQTLLSMKNEKGWALVSKGENVLELGYNDRMMIVLEGFDNWRNNVLELQGFDNAFKAYYESTSERVPLNCFHFQLENIRSGVPMTIYCPDESCGLKMEVESVNYKCCHGMHYEHGNENGGVADNTPVLKSSRILF